MTAPAMTAATAADKGKVYGKWTIIDPFADRDHHGRRLVLARCACGTEKVVHFRDLKNGRSRQCRQCADRRGEDFSSAMRRDLARTAPANAAQAQARRELAAELRRVGFEEDEVELLLGFAERVYS